MFKPARMTRILVGGHKARLDEVIEILHKEKLVHLEDFDDPTGTTTIGTPLEHGDRASDLLVHTRGLLKSLGAEGTPAKALTTGDPEKALRDAEKAVQPALERVAALRHDIARLDGEVAALAPFAGLDFDLAALGGLRSVRGYVGTVKQPPAVPVDHELTQDGSAVAVVVAAADAEACEKALSAAGFSAAQLPAGLDGTPKGALSTRTAEHAALVAELQQAEERLQALRAEWGPRLAALERHLATEVAKTQAPLQFAVTQTTFHVEGWVPRAKANRLQNALSARLGDGVYFEELGDAPKGHGAGHEDDHGHHDVSAADEAPVHLQNKGLAKPYEFMLNLLGRPRYNEIDPTKLMLIFFPLFFGLMVGDVVVGLVIAGFGAFLKKNKVFGIGGPAVGRALLMGGVMAAVFGGVVFGEALGVHFVVDDEALEDGEHSWEEIMYGKEAVLAGEAGFPHEGFIFKHTEAAHAPAEGAITTHAKETEEHGGLLTPHGKTHLSVKGWFNLGYYSKVHDIQALLVWSVLIGIVHLTLGFMLGVRNVAVSHGIKLAVQEKVSWLGIMASVPLVVFGLGGDKALLAAGVGLFVVCLVLLWMGVQHTLGAGFIALLEIPGLAGNLLSYTRLAAIGASKAGMVLAFMAIGFDVVGGGSVHSIAGWIVYLLGMCLITALAMLSGGLQSLRLQFVEFFQKFYTGGGRAYQPFGRL